MKVYVLFKEQARIRRSSDFWILFLVSSIIGFGFWCLLDLVALRPNTHTQRTALIGEFTSLPSG